MPVSFEESIAALLDTKLAPMQAELRRLRAEIQGMRRALPPALVPPREAARALGLSLSSVRRRIADGSLPVRRLGGRVLVDLGQLHPPDEAEVARLVAVCRRG